VLQSLVSFVKQERNPVLQLPCTPLVSSPFKITAPEAHPYPVKDQMIFCMKYEPFP
jgi:hypothetical protein